MSKINLLAYYFLTITISPLISCNSPQDSIPINKFISAIDSCNSFTILENHTFIKHECKDQNDTTLEFNLSDGKLEEKIKESYKIQVDNVTKHGIYTSVVGNKTGIRESGFHFLNEPPILYVTPLKNKSEIKTHYTQPTIYLSEGTHSIPKNNLISYHIKIKNPLSDGVYYVEYDSSASMKNNYQIELVSSVQKLSIPPDPRPYALNAYTASVYIDDIEKFIPAITKTELNYFKEKGSKALFLDFLKRFNPENDLILEVYRFNPDRNRLVNKVFEEKIQGQVQSFELISIDDFIKQNLR